MAPSWFNRLLKSKPRPAPRRRPRLTLEHLETRQVPTVTTNLVNGQLIITGDNSGNTITLDHSGQRTFVNGTPGNNDGGFPDAAITAGIVINSGSGIDTVNIRATVKSVTINGQGGEDTVNVGKGGNMQAVLGPVKIINPGGHTALTLDDSANPAARDVALDVKPDAVGPVAGLFGTFTGLAAGTVSIRESDISSLIVRGGSGGNTFTVANTLSAPAFPGTILSAGDGDDVVNVLRTTGRLSVDTRGAFNEDLVNVGNAGSVQGIQGALNIITSSLGFGFYDMTLDNRADTVGRNVTVTDTSIIGLSPAPISYSFGSLRPHVTLNAGSGNDAFTVRGLPGQLILFAGGGNDTANVGSAANTLNGLTGGNGLNFFGEGGTDVVNVNDQGTTTPQTFTLDGRFVFRSNAGAFVEVDLFTESLVVNAGSGGNVFNVAGTVRDVATTLNTGTGIDTVNVKGTTGALIINGQSGRDEVNVSPSSATSVGGEVTITNAASFSRLSVNDPATIDRNVTMGIGADGFGFINGLLPAAIRYKANDVSAVVVNAGSGRDVFTITDTVSNGLLPPTLVFGGNGDDAFLVQKTTGRLTVNGGFGNDLFVVGSAGNTLDPIQGPLTVDGGLGGADALNVNDQGSTTPHTYTITPTQVFRSGAATVNFAGMEGLLVNKGPVLGNPPQAKSLGLAKSVKAGQFAVLAGRLVDLDKGDVLRLVVDWGDGTKPQALAPGLKPFSLKHLYAKPGAYTVRVIWTDSIGQSNSRDLKLIVTKA